MRRLILILGCALVLVQCTIALGDDSTAPKSHLQPVNANWSLNPDGTFHVTLTGHPSIQLNLDREYKIYLLVFDDGSLAGKDIHGLVFVPEDHQSSVSFTIGKDAHPRNEADLERTYKGTTVTMEKGNVDGMGVQRLRWTAPPHLCSSFTVTVSDTSGTLYPLAVTLIANTPERLAALEKGFSDIQFH